MTDPVDARRRSLLAGAGAALLTGVAAGARAGLAPTPRQSRGPFYPDELPLDTDNDLVRVDGRGALADGIVTDLRGAVLDPGGAPIDGATIEIWQCDANGRYIHRFDRGPGKRDPNFQGFGTTTTDAAGRYRFRTIQPVPYPGRAPHIHFRVIAPGGRELVTQLYVAGHPLNARDGILQRARDPERLIVRFRPIADAGAERRARFRIVMPG
jgi:protocatechuate 3,4-dioxygenase beta subunit